MRTLPDGRADFSAVMQSMTNLARSSIWMFRSAAVLFAGAAFYLAVFGRHHLLRRGRLHHGLAQQRPRSPRHRLSPPSAMRSTRGMTSSPHSHPRQLTSFCRPCRDAAPVRSPRPDRRPGRSLPALPRVRARALSCPSFASALPGDFALLDMTGPPCCNDAQRDLRSAAPSHKARPRRHGRHGRPRSRPQASGIPAGRATAAPGGAARRARRRRARLCR